MNKAAQWIDRTESLNTAIANVGSGPLAVDTEADSLHHYPEKVCLIQLSFGGRDLLVDPLADVSLDPLGELFADPTLVKVLHGADYDVRMLHRGFGIEFRGLFDTMIAARLVGETRFGLAALLEQFFGVPLDKKFQRADWSRRPLSEEMAQYATMDTQYLIRLRDMLLDKLRALGRELWAQEEFERLEAVRTATASTPDDGFRRVKGGGKLERAQLAILRELWALRESRACQLDRPPFRVMHDECLIELSVRAPRNEKELAQIARLPRPWKEGRRARELLETVERGRAVPHDKLPTRKRAQRARGSSNVSDAILGPLRDHRDRLATELALDPSLLGPRAVLESIVECAEAGRDPALLADLRQWQWELLRSGLPAQAR